MDPSLASKPFFDMKVCWDGMTPDGGWIVDQHPEVKGLCVAIGGSGHGFKFLPIVGAWIAEIVMGAECGMAENVDLPTIAEMKMKWKWGRPANMGVGDPRVVLQGRSVQNLEEALVQSKAPRSHSKL